ncbi:major facilitator superfamily domain-containing protein [Achaetomium macrosporum]|uniref:Major facilitator superfamily domain-containing protein n=1 Tax=Achaetomium macrosporum TaxID=79813 RepID=A0AAN7H9Y1_9PEZI|nr:major facilitator superfamily domain-containing protein [Achaetomium macrosporum]
MPHERRHSPHSQKNPSPPSARRRAIRPVLLLVALVNLAWSLYQLPVSRIVESRLCRDHYAVHDPSALRPDGTVPEELCKVDGVQQRLGRIQGIMETLWVAGDFLMTIPLVSLADHYGHQFVLCLNLFPRVFLLCWTFLVGYFDRALPLNAILAGPVFSFLGGDCVFNSIVYSLVSELTDDHVLRATFFGYVNAVTSIFSLQLGPALASAAMNTLLWLPLWVGMALLILGIPVISALLPRPRASHRKRPSFNEEADAAAPLIPPSSPQPLRNSVISKTKSRFHTALAILTNPSRNFVLLLAVFFLAALASSDTKLLPLYISKRYTWKFSSVGYLLSIKALFNFFLLSFIIPRFLRWREMHRVTTTGSSSLPESEPEPVHADRENISLAHTSLVCSVLGALAIAISPTIWTLAPSLLLYAMGIALPMFTYSLLKSPSMGLKEEEGQGPDTGMHLFSVVMLVRTVGTLLGAVVMPSLWVMGVGIGGSALGLPYAASAVCYGLAGGLVRRMEP